MIEKGKNSISIQNNSPEIQFMLTDITNDLKESQDDILKSIGNLVKQKLVENLRKSDIKTSGYKHMIDDVQVSTTTDRETQLKKVRVRGGKRTGTKWHLLNDGTYRTKAIHFIDKALVSADEEINNIIDSHLQHLGK